MKTRYKFIRFERSLSLGIWKVINNRTGDILGAVQWYKPWKQYVFSAGTGCVFSADCLDDIQDFIGQLETEKKGGAHV